MEINNSEIRKIALELYAEDGRNVVKVAGIFRRLKNLLKRLSDPAYKKEWENVKKDNIDIQDKVNRLNKSLKEMSSALKDGDLKNYDFYLKEVKKEVSELNESFSNLYNDSKEVKEKAEKAEKAQEQKSEQKTEKPQVDSRFGERYQLSDMNDPQFIGEFKRRLPERFDLELGRPYNEPLKSFEFYKDIENRGINVSEGVRNRMFASGRELHKALTSLYGGKQKGKELASMYLETHDNGILEAFKQAIYNGTLIGVEPRTPAGPKYRGTGAPKETPWNLVVLSIKTAKVKTPGQDYGLTFDADVKLIDWSMQEGGLLRIPLSVQNVEIKNVETYREKEQEQEEIPEMSEEELAQAESEAEGEAEALEEQALREAEAEAYLGYYDEASRKDVLKKLSIITEKDRQPQLRPYKHTAVLSKVEFAQKLQKGYQMAFGGSQPSAEVLGVGWAQATLEMGVPIKLPQNNIGNIKATQSWVDAGKPYFVKSTQEHTESGRKFIHGEAKWCAFDSPEEGAKAYWELIGRRYKEAMPWMRAGDAKSAMVVMGLRGYYTFNIRKYSNSVQRLYKDFETNILPQLSGISRASDDIVKPSPIEAKNWRSEYSKEEKEAIFAGNAPETPSEISTVYKKIDDAIKRLFSEKTITNIVKVVIANSSLPVTEALVYITGENEYTDLLEFSRVSARLMRKIFGVKSSICGNGKEIEIQCSTIGNEDVAVKAMQALCDCVSAGMKKNTGKNLKAVILPGMLSRFEEVDFDNIIKNQKEFYNNMVKNG
jgi:hypothetical protein